MTDETAARPTQGPNSAPDGRGRSSRAPGYAHVVDWIYDQIGSGQVPVGSRLPSIADIAAACNVGVKTARSAVEQLAERGVLRTRQGSGTVVISVPRELSDQYTGRSSGRRIVGALVPDLTFHETLSGIESVLAERDGRLMLTCSHYEYGSECDHLDSLVSDGAQGLLCAANLARWPEGDPSFDRLRDLPVPAVLLDRRLPDGMFPRIPAVLTDLEQAGFLATSHLIELDRSRVAGVFMAGRPGEPELRRGFRAALAARGVRPDPALELAAPDFDGTEVVDRLIDLDVDAVFVGGGHLAASVLSRLLLRRRKVPQEIAVAAYDARGGEVSEIPLTSVSPQRAAIGRLATTMLMDLLAHPRTAATGEFRVHPTLIARRSTTGVG